MKFEHRALCIPGLQQPIRIFVMSDTHLMLVSQQDSAEVQSLASSRSKRFCDLEPWDSHQPFHQLLEQARALGSDCVAMTGDMMDFLSQGNLAYLEDRLAQLPSMFYVVGNHDSPATVKDPILRERWQELLASRMGTAAVSKGVACKSLGQVLLVGVDNSGYQVTQEQYDLVKTALEQGLPTLLFCHIPLYCPDLCERTRQVWNAPILMGCPQEVCKGQSFGNSTLLPTAVTRAFVRLLQEKENLVALVSGHVHFSHTEYFAPGKVQIVTGCGAKGTGRVLDLMPETDTPMP